MIYLDYSATTPVDKKILELYLKDNEFFFANANSLHKLGIAAAQQIDQATEDIKKILRLNNHNFVYTSGATEANNIALKGVALSKKNKGNHIITSAFEHSSITNCLNYLAKQGFVIDVVSSDEAGLINLEELKKLITDKTILVTIGVVNSETGIKQDLSKIYQVVKANPETLFHSDMTQAIGKVISDFNYVDLASLSAHKIYGLKGIGGLIIREGIKITPLIHGGKSTSALRAGTPPTPLILSLRNAIKFSYEEFDEKQKTIKEIHDYLLNKLHSLTEIEYNSNSYSINQIVNVSFLDILSQDLQQKLSNFDIFVSTSTACASERPISLTIKYLTGSIERAETSIRISLSHLTTKSEIDAFITAIKEIRQSENN
jgi:cysteine desulfurase